ncbi:MAG: hypothetical protein ACJ71Q_02640 [Terriglobales bacterium]
MSCEPRSAQFEELGLMVKTWSPFRLSDTVRVHALFEERRSERYVTTSELQPLAGDDQFAPPDQSGSATNLTQRRTL